MLFQDSIACQMPILLFDTWRIRIGELIRAKLSVYLIALMDNADGITRGSLQSQPIEYIVCRLTAFLYASTTRVIGPYSIKRP